MRKKDMVEFMKQLKDEAEKAMEMDITSQYTEAKRLRKLVKEQIIKNKKMTFDNQEDKEFFEGFFQHVFLEIQAKTVGVLSKEKAGSFLYDVTDYCNYYLPTDK